MYLQSNFIFFYSSTDITEIDTFQRLAIEKNRKVFFTTVKKILVGANKFWYSTMFQKETDFILYLNGYEVRGYLGMKATTSSHFHFKYIFFCFILENISLQLIAGLYHMFKKISCFTCYFYLFWDS